MMPRFAILRLRDSLLKRYPVSVAMNDIMYEAVMEYAGHELHDSIEQDADGMIYGVPLIRTDVIGTDRPGVLVVFRHDHKGDADAVIRNLDGLLDVVNVGARRTGAQQFAVVVETMHRDYIDDAMQETLQVSERDLFQMISALPHRAVLDLVEMGAVYARLGQIAAEVTIRNSQQN